jgi:CheY-like chemotaxis protein
MNAPERAPRGKILSIEDQPDTICGTMMILQRRGYEIDYALTLEEARAKLREENYELIVVDILMPEHNGGKPVHGGGVLLLEQLKEGKLGDLNKTVPFVVATAQAAFVDTIGKVGRQALVMSSDLLRTDCLRVDAKIGDIVGLANLIDRHLSNAHGVPETATDEP